jgi:hypothetical protein
MANQGSLDECRKRGDRASRGWYSSAVKGVYEEEDRGDATGRSGKAGSVATACVGLYLAVVLVLFLVIRHRNDGVFTYTLDDPYIHLALAQSLAHGHYGINPGEASSPSSSIVWPFLLVPFAGYPTRILPLMYAPLLWNILFCGLAAWLIGRTVDGWTWRPRADAYGAMRGEWVWRFTTAALLMLVANLAGLTFVGMEHGLQVLLAIACAAGLVEVFHSRPIPAWCLCAAVLGPMVRYESFALVAAVAVALYGQRRVRAAAWVVVLSAIGPLLFSIFLLSRGLPALPSSVLVKAMVYSFHPSLLMTCIATVMRSVMWGVREVSWWNQLAAGLLLIWLAVREKRRGPRFVLGGALFAAFLQLTIGRFHWFYRYEVYAIGFTAIVAWAALMESTRLGRWKLTAGLVSIAWLYAVAVHETPGAAANVYQQQYQTHRFMAGFHGRAVAVNDLGLVSYDRPAGVYVLDLWGLASPEASRRFHKDAGWLDAITRSHSAGLAILYPSWYEDGAPDDWSPLGTMCITGRRISISRRCVVFYSTPQGDRDALQAELAVFSRSLPPSVKMTLGRDSTDVDDPEEP